MRSKSPHNNGSANITVTTLKAPHSREKRQADVATYVVAETGVIPQLFLIDLFEEHAGGIFNREASTKPPRNRKNGSSVSSGRKISNNMAPKP